MPVDSCQKTVQGDYHPLKRHSPMQLAVDPSTRSAAPGMGASEAGAAEPKEARNKARTCCASILIKWGVQPVVA